MLQKLHTKVYVLCAKVALMLLAVEDLCGDVVWIEMEETFAKHWVEISFIKTCRYHHHHRRHLRHVLFKKTPAP